MIVHFGTPTGEEDIMTPEGQALAGAQTLG